MTPFCFSLHPSQGLAACVDAPLRPCSSTLGITFWKDTSHHACPQSETPCCPNAHRIGFYPGVWTPSLLTSLLAPLHSPRLSPTLGSRLTLPVHGLSGPTSMLLCELHPLPGGLIPVGFTRLHCHLACGFTQDIQAPMGGRGGGWETEKRPGTLGAGV